MDELIRIREDRHGKMAVSARELYEKLQLAKGHWAIWSKRNIENNEFATEGEDWTRVDLVVNYAETKDYYLSINFAKKLCMLARTEIGEKIREYFLECERIATQSEPALPYHLRRHMANVNRIPHTHFSILTELIVKLIAPLEALGYTMPDDMLPDISEGKMFCRYLRDTKRINTDILPTYRHEYEDGRIVNPKMYPIEIYPDFVRHFFDVWLPTKAKAYFEKRDPSALPYLDRHLRQLPASTIRVTDPIPEIDD